MSLGHGMQCMTKPPGRRGVTETYIDPAAPSENKRPTPLPGQIMAKLPTSGGSNPQFGYGMWFTFHFIAFHSMLDQVPEYWAVIRHAAEELAGFSSVVPKTHQLWMIQIENHNF